MEYTKVSIKWAQFQIKLKDLCYRGAFVTRKENKKKYSGELTHMYVHQYIFPVHWDPPPLRISVALRGGGGGMDAHTVTTAYKKSLMLGQSRILRTEILLLQVHVESGSDVMSQ